MSTGRLPIATPDVHAAGVRDGWGYLLMSRLNGANLADAWPDTSEADREPDALAARWFGC